jgi:hypothetical protein
MNQKEFDVWVESLDTELETLLSSLPKKVSEQLDYSLESIIKLEEFLLDRFKDRNDLERAENSRLVNQLTAYVGQSICCTLGGHWAIELADKEHMYFGEPVVVHPSYVMEYPASYIFAPVTRRTGRYLSLEVQNLREIASVKNTENKKVSEKSFDFSKRCYHVLFLFQHPLKPTLEQYVALVNKKYESRSDAPSVSKINENYCFSFQGCEFWLFQNSEKSAVDEAREIAQFSDSTNRQAISESRCRFELYGGPDTEGKYFNDYVVLLQIAESLGKVWIFDPEKTSFL